MYVRLRLNNFLSHTHEQAYQARVYFLLTDRVREKELHVASISDSRRPFLAFLP